jgi:hypothetical protein
LGPEFFPFLLEFLKHIIAHRSPEDQIDEIAMIATLYIQNRAIVAVTVYTQVLELILASMTALSTLTEVWPFICKLSGLISGGIEFLWPVVKFEKARLNEIPHFFSRSV